MADGEGSATGGVDIAPGARQLVAYDDHPYGVLNAGGDPWRGTSLDAEDHTDWNLVLVTHFDHAANTHRSAIHLVRNEEVRQWMEQHVAWVRYTA